jgi:hypothetical protein
MQIIRFWRPEPGLPTRMPGQGRGCFLDDEAVLKLWRLGRRIAGAAVVLLVAWLAASDIRIDRWIPELRRVGIGSRRRACYGSWRR